MIRRILEAARAMREYVRLPGAARAERRRDLRDGLGQDPGRTAVVTAGLRWLAHAQDHSSTHDGGVARHWSLVSGWGPSYPETTGYIIPTILTAAQDVDGPLRERARRMLEWLLAIQLRNGAFPAGTVDSRPHVASVFNTGQILLGLSAGVRVFGDRYRPALRAAADWLVARQDPDGAWRRHQTPFAAPGEKAYHTHVGWGLVEAARLEPKAGYGEAALRNARWALTQQSPNGWFARCNLSFEVGRLTHTIAYALRGLIEVFRFSREPALLDGARRAADGLLTVLEPSGFLSGRVELGWRGTTRWACLTGSLQVACCWLELYQETGDARYRDAAVLASRWVRRTVRVTGPDEVCGAVKGSFPVSGGYAKYEYVNWGVKFLIDESWLELELAPDL